MAETQGFGHKFLIRSAHKNFRPRLGDKPRFARLYTASVFLIPNFYRHQILLRCTQLNLLLRRRRDSKLTVSVPQLGILFRKLIKYLNRASNPRDGFDYKTCSTKFNFVKFLLRRRRDSNPGGLLDPASLAVRCFRPLSHVSIII